MGMYERAVLEDSPNEYWRLNRPDGVTLDGAANSYVSTPDAAAFGITGDIDVRVHCALTIWDTTAPAAQVLLSQWGAAPNQGWRLTVSTSGTLQFVWSPSGSDQVATSSTVLLSTSGIANGGQLWVRVTLDVDNGAGGNDVKYFYSRDGLTWTQLGATVTTAGVTSIFDTSAAVVVGGRADNAFSSIGTFYAAEIRNGINGTPVSVLNLQVPPTSSNTWTDKQGQVWTLGGNSQPVLRSRLYGCTKPAILGSYVSTPDSAALSVTGDLDVRVQLAPNNWLPAGHKGLVTKWNTVGNNRSWQLRVLTSGQLYYMWSVDGSAELVAFSSVIPFAGNQLTWVRVTHDVDNGAAGNDVKWYSSLDGVTWTQLGTTKTTAGVTSIFDGNAAVEIGSSQSGTAEVFEGIVYQAEIRNGIDGTIVANPKFGVQPKIVTGLSYSQLVSRDAPEAYWRLGESSGTTAVDATGHGHSLTYTGSPTLGVAGAIPDDTATAATFAAGKYATSTSYVSALNPATSFSFEAWVLVNGGGGATNKYVAYTGLGVPGWLVYINTVNTAVVFQMRNGANNGNRIVTGAAPNVLGNWHHIVCTYDAGTDTQTLYINGVSVGTPTTTGGYAATTTLPFFLSYSQSNTEFHGSMQDAAIYNTALTVGQIREHYYSGRARVGYPRTAAFRDPQMLYSERVKKDQPVGWWRLGEPSGTTALDSSGRGNAMTYTGSPTLGVAGAIIDDADTAVTFGEGKIASTGSYVAALNPQGSFTVEAWILWNGAAPSTDTYVVDSRPVKGYRLAFNPVSGVLAFSFRNGADNGVRNVVSAAIQASVWTHVCCTYDAATDTQTLYVNGVSVGTPTTTGGYSAQTTAATQLSSATALKGWPGTLDEVAIYDYALSAQQVQAHLYAGKYSNVWSLNGAASMASGPSALTATGQPTLGVDGPLANDSATAVALTTGQYLTTPYHPGNNPAVLSVECWLRLSAVGATQWIINNQNGATGYGLYMNTSNKVVALIGASAAAVTSTPALVANRWYHIVLTSSGNAQVLYIDGDVAGTGTATYVVNTAGLLRVSYTSSQLSGRVAEVAVYPSVLTRSQVRKHFRIGRHAGVGIAL